MVCPKCETVLKDGETVCPICGTPVDTKSPKNTSNARNTGNSSSVKQNISNKYNGELVINEEDKKISISIILNILYDK